MPVLREPSPTPKGTAILLNVIHLLLATSFKTTPQTLPQWNLDPFRRSAQARYSLKLVEEVQEEVQEIKDDCEDEEVEGTGGLKVDGEPHTSCVDEMTCATCLSHAV